MNKLLLYELALQSYISMYIIVIFPSSAHVLQKKNEPEPTQQLYYSSLDVNSSFHQRPTRYIYYALPSCKRCPSPLQGPIAQHNEQQARAACVNV